MGSDAETLYDEGRVVPESSGCSAVTSSEDEGRPRRRARRCPPLFPHVVTPKGRFKKLHPCQYCDAVFHKKAKLIAHERTHTGERPFMCSVCSASFSRNTHLRRHQATHATGDSKTFPCDVCGFQFRCRDHLRRHQSRDCLPNKHQCSECGMVVASEYHLRKHLGKHERQRQKDQEAAPGNARAASPPRAAVPILCDVCDELLEDKRALRKHITASHGYKCPECDKYFASMDERRSHMRTHTHEVYKCTYEGCGRAYSRQSNLRQHVRSKHLYERHECPVCRAACTFRGVLQRHMHTYHPEEAAAMSQTSTQPAEDLAGGEGGEKKAELGEEALNETAAGPEEPSPKRPRLVLKPKQRRPYPRALFSRLLGPLPADLDLGLAVAPAPPPLPAPMAAALPGPPAPAGDALCPETTPGQAGEAGGLPDSGGGPSPCSALSPPMAAFSAVVPMQM